MNIPTCNSILNKAIQTIGILGDCNSIAEQIDTYLAAYGDRNLIRFFVTTYQPVNAPSGFGFNYLFGYSVYNVYLPQYISQVVFGYNLSSGSKHRLYNRNTKTWSNWQ